MSSIRFGIVAVAVAWFVSGSPAQAETIRVKPGQWRVETTSSNPFAGSQTFSSTQCIREEQFDPAQEMAKSAECRMLSQDVRGNTMSWAMSCQMEQMVMRAEGKFESQGDSAQGQMIMTTDMGGQPFSLEMTWSGQRVGPCD